MDAASTEEAPILDAGPIAAWVAQMVAAIEGESDADVACGSCTGCCASSQFVHIGPDEADTLHHIPRALLSPAPFRPVGHLVMGFDERGRCPMLGEHGCSIYDHRPRTCRTYDCRVFTATGVTPTEATHAAVAERVRRWRFGLEAPTDRERVAALRAAAAAVESPGLAADVRPVTSTQRAVAAFLVHELFLPIGSRPAADELAAQLRAGIRGRRSVGDRRAHPAP